MQNFHFVTEKISSERIKGEAKTSQILIQHWHVEKHSRFNKLARDADVNNKDVFHSKNDRIGVHIMIRKSRSLDKNKYL